MATRLAMGNAAVVIGALYAGCDAYFGYPITPASEVLQEASRCFPPLGRTFVQAESEEAAINMVYGAAAAGGRVLCASSGPGISLKQEGLSYMAGCELPCVLVDVMRAGPGLGNIGPEQGDYNQLVKGGGHGNYRNIVLAPGSVQEMCDLTMLAFELAERYRNPCVVLTDGMLGQMVEPLVIPERAVAPGMDSSRAVAGTAQTGGNLVTSIFLDFDVLESLNDRLQEKYRRLDETEQRHEETGCEDAGVIMVAYGASSRIARTAVEILRADGVRAGLFRPITLSPLPVRRLRQLASKPVRFISVEMSNGQMRDDIRLAIGDSRPVELVARMGGNLVKLDQIVSAVREADGARR